MSEFWSYDEAARTITDENGLTVARDVGAADGHAIIAAARGDAGLAYDAGYDDGNTDATNEATAAAQALVDAAKAFLHVATWDEDTDADEFDPAYEGLKAALKAWDERT